jgi:hypothetical protein
VVDWTLNDSKDPGQCAASGAQDLDVIVRNGGVLIGDFVTSCEDFSESIRLGSGTYDVDAVLLDSAGNDRTTAVPIGPVQIFGGDQLVVPVNFPSDSFL